MFLIELVVRIVFKKLMTGFRLVLLKSTKRFHFLKFNIILKVINYS